MARRPHPGSRGFIDERPEARAPESMASYTFQEAAAFLQISTIRANRARSCSRPTGA